MTHNLIFTHLEAINNLLGPLIIFGYILFKAFHVFFTYVLWQYLEISKTNYNVLCHVNIKQFEILFRT